MSFRYLAPSIVCLFVITMAIQSFPATAHEGATGIVKERMGAMKSLGDAMKRLTAIMKGEAPYDSYAVVRNADFLVRHGGDAMTRMFPVGSNPHPSEALPTIWEEWPKFENLAQDLTRKASALRTVAQTPSANPSDAAIRHFRDTARTCKACHDDFRQRKP